MQSKMGSCKNCHKYRQIVNRHGLCKDCNVIRIENHKEFLGLKNMEFLNTISDSLKIEAPKKRESSGSAFMKNISPGKPAEEKSSKQDTAFYLMCEIQLPHVCGYCDNPIYGTFDRNNCDHVFPKAQFRHLRYVIEDICPTCWDCHQVKTSGKYTERMKQVFFKVCAKLVSMGLLEEIGEPDPNRLKDWVIKPPKP